MKLARMNWTANALAIAMLLPAGLTGQETDKEPVSEAEEVVALLVGDEAPDFELMTFDDKTVKLSERFGDEGHAVVLVFSRAHW